MIDNPNFKDEENKEPVVSSGDAEQPTLDQSGVSDILDQAQQEQVPVVEEKKAPPSLGLKKEKGKRPQKDEDPTQNRVKRPELKEREEPRFTQPGTNNQSRKIREN